MPSDPAAVALSTTRSGISATHLDAGRGDYRCGCVRPGQVDYLVAGGEEVGMMYEPLSFSTLAERARSL